jgi:hypothetical protein
MENIANGFQLVPHGIAKHKCIGHLQVLRGRLDTNNLRTSETKIMNQSMITLGQCTLYSEWQLCYLRRCIKVEGGDSI